MEITGGGLFFVIRLLDIPVNRLGVSRKLIGRKTVITLYHNALDVDAFVCMHACVFAGIPAWMHACLQACVKVCASMCACTLTCVQVRACVLIVCNKARTQIIAKREFLLWKILQGTEY